MVDEIADEYTKLVAKEWAPIFEASAAAYAKKSTLDTKISENEQKPPKKERRPGRALRVTQYMRDNPHLAGGSSSRTTTIATSEQTPRTRSRRDAQLSSPVNSV